jgi:hypothetical protein
VDGADGSVGGKASTSSSGAGGIKGGEVADGGRERGSEDGKNDGGVAVQERGERRSLPSPSGPYNSSTSLHHLLVLFAGGVITSCGKGGISGPGVGDVGDGDVGVSREPFSPAGAVTTEEGKRTKPSPTAVAALPRRQRRWCLPAVAVVMVDVDRHTAMLLRRCQGAGGKILP